MKKTLLVDCDIIVYRCGFAAERSNHKVKLPDGTVLEFSSKKDLNEWAKTYEGDIELSSELEIQPVEFALNNANTVIAALNGKFPDCNIEYFLTGKGNFREQIATIKPYKGNRKDARKPEHYEAIRDYLVSRYGAEIVDGQEADDAIGIRATELGEDCVIVSTDKDLDTIPGEHYNWVEKRSYCVSVSEAYRNFYIQVLTGDSTDNIPGIYGVATKTAKRILKGYTKPKALWQACLAAYVEHYPDGYEGRGIREAVEEIAKLLYIRKRPGEIWVPPQ